MFSSNSRYARLTTYTITTADGLLVTATRLPLPRRGRLLGDHPRREGERLDLLAGRYLDDATLFWRLCDDNNVLSADALMARDRIGISKQSGDR